MRPPRGSAVLIWIEGWNALQAGEDCEFMAKRAGDNGRGFEQEQIRGAGAETSRDSEDAQRRRHRTMIAGAEV